MEFCRAPRLVAAFEGRAHAYLQPTASPPPVRDGELEPAGPGTSLRSGSQSRELKLRADGEEQTPS